MDPITTFVLRYSPHFRKLTTLLRYIELLILTALAFWSSTHLPTAARSSSDILRHVIIPIVIGPRFLFIVSNLIIISLLYLSRHSPAADSTPDPVVAAFAPPLNEVDAVFEDKEVVCVVERDDKHVRAACRRTKSSLTVEKKRRSPELRRSETDVKNVNEEEEEEFRRAVEAFIEKQRNFILSEEENNIANANRHRNLAIVESTDVIII